ncbi:MAG TPA: nucleoside transporter C-terminal domain-containing protein [bacterium]
MEIYNLVSLAGIFLLMGFAWLCSPSKRNMNWRAVFWGTAFQLIFAFFVFVFPPGVKVFLFINDAVVKVLDSAGAGSRFVFGRLALPPETVSETGETSLGFMLAFQGFPTIIFFAALMALLYHFKVMPFLIRGFAYVFTKWLRVSGAESLSVSANIFVGVESALTVRPYLEKMASSELHTILTAGMATVASNILALYVFMLRGQFPTIAGHLVSASILAAPAAIVMSKILLPESEKPETLGVHIHLEYAKEKNWIEAVISGANDGVKLIVGIVALLLAFLGLTALVDLALGWMGGGVNQLFGWHVNWSLKTFLGYLFYPFTLAIGIPPSDAWEMAKIIGERAVVTEVTAYRDLADVMAKGVLVHPRSVLIATYALCGFAHIASLAIFVGGTAALAPKRKNDLARLGPRALLAATLACLMTAAVAGTFYTGKSILIGK